MLSVSRAGAALLSLFLLASCGGGSSSAADPGPVGQPAPHGSLAFASASYSASQAAASVTVTVSRSGGSAGAATVAYRTADGTATAASDYVAASGTLSWADGDAADKSVTIQIGTQPFAGEKAFLVSIDSPTGGTTLGASTSTNVTITGLGAPGTLSFAQASYGVIQSAGSVTLTVTRTGGSAGSVGIAYSTVDGSAAAGTDYVAAAGTLDWADGDMASKSVTVQVSAVAFIGSKAFQVLLSNPSGGAVPGLVASAAVTISGTGSAGMLALGQATYSVAQSAGAATLTVTRTGGSIGAVGVGFATVAGTAVAGVDFQSTSGVLSWADGDSADKRIVVPVSTAAFAGTKGFQVTLSASTGGATVAMPSASLVNILGSGSPGSLAISQSAYSVVQSAGSATITVSRSGGSAGAVGATISTASGTALSGTDFTAASSTLAWADGDVAPKNLVVPLATKPFVGSKAFQVSLSSATGGAAIGLPSTATVTIAGSGSPGTLALAQPTYTVAQASGSATLSVTRSGGSTGAVNVSYATANGTALAGTDYTATNGTLAWADGDVSSKAITVPLSATAFVGSKAFTVALSAPGGAATLGTPTSSTVTINGSGATGSATVSLAAASYGAVVGASSVAVTVNLVRSGTGSGAVTASYATADGSALAATDYTATSGSLSWAANDSSSRTITIALLPTATAGRSFGLQLGSATGATLAQPTTATVALSAPPSGMPLISRGAPAFASSGTATYGNDGNYNHAWRSSGAPATLAYDLSAVTPAPSTVLVAWYNETSYGYDHALLGGAGYNNPGSYSIEVNAAPGGGSAPATGWVTAATVTGNTLHSREHLIAFAGYHWIRLNATVSDGTTSNMDIAVKMDVHDASSGVGDGWFFAGDSITANCMGHGTEGGSTYDSFGNEVLALKGRIPPQENAGMAGWSTQNYATRIAGWLAGFPGKYVAIGLGTNDAAGGVAPAAFYTQYESMVKAVLAAGKVAVVPTIPWSPDPIHAANIPGLNAQIQLLYGNYPQVLKGPDLYAFFLANPGYISADNIHPTAAGCGAMRSQWAQLVSTKIY